MPGKYSHICEVCAHPFTSKRPIARFCTRECHFAGTRAQIFRHPCEQCGEPLAVRAKHKHHRFCSTACAARARGHHDVALVLTSQRLIDPATGCWLWDGSTSKDGYGRVLIAQKEWRVHRLAYTHFVGPIPEGLDVCHNCPGGDNPTCFNPAHLWLGDNVENSADRHLKGRDARGEQHGGAKLTADQVIEIRALVARKVRHAEIGARFGVSRPTVTAIANRRLWKHIA